MCPCSPGRVEYQSLTTFPSPYCRDTEHVLRATLSGCVKREAIQRKIATIRADISGWMRLEENPYTMQEMLASKHVIEDWLLKLSGFGKPGRTFGKGSAANGDPNLSESHLAPCYQGRT